MSYGFESDLSTELLKLYHPFPSAKSTQLGLNLRHLTITTTNNKKQLLYTYALRIYSYHL